MHSTVSRRANVFARRAGLLFTLGSALWLVAFYLPVSFLLSIANLLSAAGLTWMGVDVYPRTRTGTAQARQTA
jgi:hypothetical protein